MPAAPPAPAPHADARPGVAVTPSGQVVPAVRHSPLAWLLAWPIRFYRRFLSPLFPPACRYEPSCSRYALEALAVHGAFKGTYLTLHRLARCQPWGGHGHDPVPPPRAARA